VKLLLANCIRVQKSVFEGLLNDKEFIELKKKLDDKIDYTTDSIRYYHICRNCVENILISGQGLYTVEEDVIVV
jgi:CRISPR-associated protein Cas2